MLGWTAMVWVDMAWLDAGKNESRNGGIVKYGSTVFKGAIKRK